MAGALSSLRGRLRDGRLVGTFVKLPALESVEICAQSLDFCVVDYEHSQLSEADVLRLVRHSAAIDFAAVVRIPEVDRGLVNRLLEAGAAGIQLSSARRVDEVRALASAVAYAPDGSRSISLAHPQARYGAVPLREYLVSSESPLVVIQLETRETDDPPVELCRAGADVAFLGLTDLLVDCALDEAAATARADELAGAVREAGIALGGFGTEERFRYAVVSSDVALLREAVAGVH
ncbi:MAG TPA: aldolase/citrate lyase family protein [Gaiellaceae bacterium]|nr:aldolase/citrate lyase family protein [Gaiellaceae bacterium]